MRLQISKCFNRVVPTDSAVVQSSRDDRDLKSFSVNTELSIAVISRGYGSAETLTEGPVRHSQSYFACGWRTGACLGLAAVSCSLIISTAITIWISKSATSEDGLAQLYLGDCGRVQSMNTWVHLAVNLLSTAILAGSNYIMQVLVAPSRKEIDQAHSRGKWLDIGVPSMRNLRSTSWVRKILWLVLGVSSVPLHLLFNSAFYSALASNDYNIIWATESFIQGAAFATPIGFGTPSRSTIQSIQTNVSNYQRLSNADCITAYAQDFLSDRRNVVVISSNSTDGDSLLNSAVFLTMDDFYDPYSWICPVNNSGDGCYEMVDALREDAAHWSPFGYRAEFCLSETVASRCSLNANQPILIVVIVCNAIKMIVMIYVIACLQFEPILVVGDAIQTFLTVPDETTKNICLLTRELVARHSRKMALFWPVGASTSQIRDPSVEYASPLPAASRRRRWYAASSTQRTALVSCLFVACVVTVTVFLALAIVHLRPMTFARIQALGFGTVSEQDFLIGGFPWLDQLTVASQNVLYSSMVANLPQLIFSFLYFTVNSYLTVMFMANEWSSYATNRKTLRVSQPRDSQRRAYFLQLPYKAAIPLMTISTLLHWVLSRAIFLVVISEWNADGELANAIATATCGYSPLAILIVLILGLAVIATLTGISFKRYNGFIPLVSSCSAAIAASCHPPPWEDPDAVLKPMKWGVVKRPDASDTLDLFFDTNRIAGHCTFSSGDVETPVEGASYAGL